MTFKIIEFILPKRDSRGRKIGKNVLLLGLFQSISIISSFLLVPMTINYISTSQYGIWLTISSIVGWFSLVDIGLGAGLRNRLTEALAKHDTVLASKYVSNTYLMLGIIVLFLFFLFVRFFSDARRVSTTDVQKLQSIITLPVHIFKKFILFLYFPAVWTHAPSGLPCSGCSAPQNDTRNG